MLENESRSQMNCVVAPKGVALGCPARPTHQRFRNPDMHYPVSPITIKVTESSTIVLWVSEIALSSSSRQSSSSFSIGYPRSEHVVRLCILASDFR